MKSFFKSALILLLISYNSLAFSQNSELGFMLGGTYYQGDINTNKLFQSPFFAGGILYRYNFSSRYALRGSIIMGKLISNDGNSNFAYQQQRGSVLRKTIFDVTPQVEFNFNEYLPNDPNYIFTPYVSVGFTFMYAPISGIHLAIPFGVGIKYSLSPKVSTGIEWTYRKTFSDKIDNVPDFTAEGKQNSYQQDNDWYSYAGIFIAFRFSTKKVGRCPAYSVN